MSVAFFVVGLVAVVARFGPGVGPVRMPGLIDRSIAMYFIRQLRGTLDPGEMPEADGPDAVVEAGPAILPAKAAGSDPPESPRVIPQRRDLSATRARLAAIGARRAEPILRPATRRPISLAARSVTADRLTPMPSPPLWRRLALDRRITIGRAGEWKQAEVMMAAVVVVVALVAVFGFVGQPSPAGGVLASTGRPQPTTFGDVGPPSAASASPVPSPLP